MPPHGALCLLLGAAQAVIAASLHLSAGDAGTSGAQFAVYQAPPTYKEPGKPRLNSIIIKSKPYHVNDSLHYHQTHDGKSWRREVSVTTTTMAQDSTQESTQPTTPTTQETAVYQQFSIDCTAAEKECSETINLETTTMQAPTFKPYSKEELDKFLFHATMTQTSVPQTSPVQKADDDDENKPTNKLANLYIEDEAVNVLETTPDPSTVSHQDKSKSWNLVNAQTHKHPYDDRNGWVSLEPIPWSSSQIQKWEPNPHTRPQIPAWSENENNRPWSSPPQHADYKPSWVKPTYDYKPQENNYPKPGWSYSQDGHRPPAAHQGGGGGGSWGGSGDIITDGRPGQFPSWQEQGGSASFHRPTQVVYHKDNYNYNHPHQSKPEEGDGRWVLLSSTKGYSVPQRHRGFQRSLRLEDATGSATDHRPVQQAMKSHRTVRLTVLPPLDGTTNTTISHGGLIEVEQTAQTVDEAQREHAAKMLRLERLEAPQRNETAAPKAERRVGTTMRVVPTKPIMSSKARNNAVLAAVGAGMIPATMAMLLPVVLGRRKREAVLEQPFPPPSDHTRRRKPIRKINLRKKTEVVYY